MACGGVTYGSGGLASVSSLQKDDKPTLYTGTSSALSVVAGRIPFVLGLTGPCLSIDTACCSSLVATHVATKALAAGECDAALAATVGLLSEPASTAFSIAGMLSPTGRCFSFDKAANGYVRGEGCVTFVLDAGSRMRQNMVGNDPAALTSTPPGILGSSVQQDGVSASLTAPNGTAQRKLISAVFSDGMDGSAWTTLEAHGTGTALGDPIEIGAASSILCAPLPGSKTKRSARCTSFKANVGHLEGAAAAAGMVALFSTSLSGGSLSLMSPNALLRQLNGHLRTFVKTNQFYLPVSETSLATASQDGPHTARLSSFGFSGTIAHARFEAGDRAAAIVEQYAAEKRPELFRSKMALPLVSRVPRGRVKMQASAISRIHTGDDVFNLGDQKSDQLSLFDDDDESVEEQIIDVAAIVNGIMGFDVDKSKPLMDVGLDSFVAGELMNQLSAAAKADLPATLLFDYPSVESLDKYMRSDEMILASNIDNESAERRRRRAERRRLNKMKVPPSVSSSGDLLISRRALRPQILIGRDARVPIATTSSSLYDLCAVHANNWSAVSSMPASRFDEDFATREKYPVAATYGGFISVEEIERFANETFSLSRAEASAMDPQQRLALEVGHSVLVGEGNYSIDDLIDANIGCYVGVQTSDFFDLARRPTSGVSQTYLATGANHAVASGRIPYTFGLRGASMAITTACSTALVCCHEARAGLEISSNSNAALIVAVNLNLLGAMTASVAKAGMLSPRGKCHTLDERADGYVRSEGCVGILLRLHDEQKEHSSIATLSVDNSTVISSTAVRSDGKSASLTAPSGLAQQQLLREALHDAATSKLNGRNNVSSPVLLSHVELHGTGTALGDPIEIGALTAVALREQAPPTLAAIKANVGHSETCSGAFGLAVLSNLALLSQRAAPQACLRQLNSRLIHFAKKFIGPVEQTLKNTVHGGVSSFGFSGAIAHIQLDRDLSLVSNVDQKHSENVDRIGLFADDFVRPFTSLITEHGLAIRRSYSRFPLVESRAPTPAAQRASALANINTMIQAKRIAEEGDGDTRQVRAYEVQWTPKSLAPKCTTYSEDTPEKRTIDDIDGKYGWPQADGLPTKIEDTSRLALIIGAGLDGVLCAAAFARNGIEYVVFEKNDFMAGVWVTQANATSKVQTGKLTYTLDLDDQSPDVSLESSFQPADEVCVRITEFAMRMGIDKRTYSKREVLGVRHGSRHDENFVTWRDLSRPDASTIETQFAAVIFACGALRAPTLAPALTGASIYRGFDSYGVAADMAPCEMAGRDIVIAGHGAYGVENVRTGLEHGAKSITVICRHRHSVLPRCAVWTLDAGREFDAWSEISQMLSLAKLGHAYTTDRRKRPAVSDQYYVAMRYGRARVIHGQITGFDVDARTNRPVVVIDNALRVPADISLLCYGFSKQTTFINQIMGVDELTGIWVNGRRTLAILKGDLDVRREATPLSASNIPYASFLANVIAQFLKHPQDFEKILPKLPKADKNQDTTSFDFFASIFLTLISNQDVKPHFDKLVRRVQHTSVRDVMPWDSFIKDCTADWRRYLAVCNPDGSSQDDITYADWPQRQIPVHREGFGLSKKDQFMEKPAPNWITVIDGSNIPSSFKETEALICGDSKHRSASMLCITFPNDLSSLATLMRFAATNSHIKSTLVVLSNKMEIPFLAQLRVARVELPKFKISSITVDPAFPPSPGMIESVLTRNGLGIDIRIGPEPRELIPTLSSWNEHRSDIPNRASAQPRGGRALVTGGTGALGLVTSSLLLETGAASLVVIATRQPRVKILADPLVPRLQKLAKSGRAIVVTGADTSDPEAMRNLVRLVDAGAPPFYDAQNENASSGGALVVHTAGVLHDVMLVGMERWMADKVFKPKVNCLPALASLIESSDQGRAVLFSSATVVLGGPGQTAYAAASGHLDQFAQNERLRGVYASTVQWLAVQGVGMHQEVVGSAPQWTSLRRVEEVIAHVSLGTYSPRYTSLRSPPASVTIMPEAFLKFLPPQVELDVKDDPKLKLQPVIEKKKTRKKKTKRKSSKKEKKPQNSDALETVNTAIKATLAMILEDHHDTKDDVPFMEMGVDSMGLTDFVNSLNEKLGVELPEVALFEYPTVQELRTALLEMVSAKLGDAVEDDDENDDDFEIDNDVDEYESPTTGPCNMTVRKAPRIAIASICGKLSLGDVANGEFLQGVRAGCVGVGRLPLDRIHSSLLNEPIFSEPSHRMHRGVSITDNDALKALDLPETARYGSFICTSEWTLFDNDAFGIGPAEAKVMDPQQRQLLEVGYEALVAAGLDKSGIRTYADQGRSIGNFVALQTNDFARAIVRTPKLVASTYAVSGANPAIAAGRLGYALGLRGAALCIDTACSTALVCLHEARLSFYETPDEPALVSAVNAMIDASVTEVVERAGMLSPRGRCHTFDARADGYTRGEGIVSVVLRPVTEEDADDVAASSLASIGMELASTSLRSDGKTASITAPSGTAQKELLLRAKEASAPLHDKDIILSVECHGTGTALGDPIEIGALATHIEKYEAARQGLGVSLAGVKASLGHLEPAAGFAGLAAMLCLASDETAPNPQLRTLNRQLDSALVPKYSTRQVVAGVDSGMPLPQRRNAFENGACVSSFGFSGIIANARIAFVHPYRVDGSRQRVENSLLSIKPALYRKRINYEWLEVVEPLVYGIDAHARAAPRQVGLLSAASSKANNQRGQVSELSDEQILNIVRSIVYSLGGEGSDDDDFTNMGVDSIASTELSRALAAEFDLGKLSPTFVFENPTISSAATAIKALLRDVTISSDNMNEIATSNCLIPFAPHRRTHRAALFMWSGGQGDASAFARLGARLGDDVRVFGVDRQPGATVGQMVNSLAPQIAACIPDNDTACYLGGLSVGGWLAVETAVRLERDFGKRAARIFSIDGPSPKQFRYDCSYEPHVGAAELLKGRGVDFPSGWSRMSKEERLQTFIDLLPSLGIDFIGRERGGDQPAFATRVADDLSRGATEFLATLRDGEYDPEITSLPSTEIVAFRAAERDEVMMLNDDDADPYPHIYSWASAKMPNLRILDLPTNHMHLLTHDYLLDVIASVIRSNIDPRNRPL
uniref:Uncharacterized protein n=1 Tax=Aureoumbra lagunensis TaxID=44058 RepID=A0A7S3JSP5_9STRA